MKKLNIALGNSDFESLFEQDCIFVDKSLLIRDLMDDKNQTFVFPRPRRFGKTIGLSMLRYFFEKRPDGKDKQPLFHKLKIWKAGEQYQKEQGQYPVIFFSLKDIKSLNFEESLAAFRQSFCTLYSYHQHLLSSSVLNEDDKVYFHRMLGLKATKDDLANGLRKLCEWLYKLHQKKVIVLLDEYDTPIHAGYFNQYFTEIASFMRTLLGSVFKDNVYLQKGIMTGILRIARENLFSDLNNVEVFSVLSNQYAEYFGFTQEEVDDLLIQAEIPEEREKVREWYDGFQFGTLEIYNPWSVLYFLKNEKQYMTYWVNTADNALIQETIAQSPSQVKQDMELLLAGETIIKTIDEYVILQDIAQDEERVWSFLLFSGYLKVLSKNLKGKQWLCELCIPNEEIRILYDDVITKWFPAASLQEPYRNMLKSLVMGDVDLFEGLLEDCLSNSLSYFDVKGENPEKFYHALVLGMLVALQETHQVKSNRESGIGRYDVMIIPKDKSKVAIIIEFKAMRKLEDLDSGVQIALQQIQDKGYRQELESLGLTNIIELGIAFYGKQLKLGKQ